MKIQFLNHDVDEDCGTWEVSNKLFRGRIERIEDSDGFYCVLDDLTEIDFIATQSVDSVKEAVRFLEDEAFQYFVRMSAKANAMRELVPESLMLERA